MKTLRPSPAALKLYSVGSDLHHNYCGDLGKRTLPNDTDTLSLERTAAGISRLNDVFAIRLNTVLSPNTLRGFAAAAKISRGLIDTIFPGGAQVQLVATERISTVLTVHDPSHLQLMEAAAVGMRVPPNMNETTYLYRDEVTKKSEHSERLWEFNTPQTMVDLAAFVTHLAIAEADRPQPIDS